ncbi:MAG TPA: bifunctional glutamate N-acetyltransferase/amino-acid acetyltransferase ArgJ [Acidimicrobiia bacterium]|nr:bifunctional glutamate N-acetyltransferase/amino-acid acetyltransferase ArgJ [Acidimicrobiia bacterium]
MSVTAAPGFQAGAAASGVKPGGAPDVALVTTSDRAAVPAAGVFTTNLVASAPVQISRHHLASGRAAAVVLNAGNANAATGEEGRGHARRMCAASATALGCAADDVLVCSTGLIGVPLPIDTVESGIADAAAALSDDLTGSRRAADAIRTTDTVPKEATVEATDYTVGGIAKGAAMLAPAMATMLAVITTDAAVTAPALDAALRGAVHDTFNALIVDACMSTSDTVLLLANGRAANAQIGTSGQAFADFAAAVTEVCDHLAEAMAADAEGATKLARVVVTGAASATDARLAARGVASSQLVQCSLYGADPYWGRILSELGASGATFDPERVDIAYNGITVCRDGVATPHDTAAVAAVMAQRDIEITCDLHAGSEGTAVRFTDLTHAYVDENRGTS